MTGRTTRVVGVSVRAAMSRRRLEWNDELLRRATMKILANYHAKYRIDVGQICRTLHTFFSTRHHKKMFPYLLSCLNSIFGTDDGWKRERLQKKHHNVVDCWRIIEFIAEFRSPQALRQSIKSLPNGNIRYFCDEYAVNFPWVFMLLSMLKF